ncbi:MAG: hypothetical protein JWO03_2598 [Bacteroidetes bacterium]|nr:hypothetical protein [Bacteroidota bacterium]
MKNQKYTSLIYLFVFTFFLHACNNQGKGGIAINGKEEFSDSAISSVKVYSDASGKKIIQKNNTSYDVVEFTDKEDVKKLLLKVIRSETSYVDSAASENHFTISVNGIGNSKINWTKEMKGTDIEYTYKVLVIHTEARASDQEDTYTQYSMQTGEKLMSYTYSQLMAQIFNTSNKRFFGYLSKQSATEEKPENFATISYVGSNEVIDKVDIKLKGALSLPNYTPEIGLMASQESGNTVAGEGKVVILSKTDRTFTATDISGFAMKVSYATPEGHEPITILLPVREDHVDLDNARYDKNIFEITVTTKPHSFTTPAPQAAPAAENTVTTSDAAKASTAKKNEIILEKKE